MLISNPTEYDFWGIASAVYWYWIQDSKLLRVTNLWSPTVVSLCSNTYVWDHNFTHCCLLLMFLLSAAYFPLKKTPKPHFCYFPRECNVIYQMIISTITLYSSSKVQCHPAIWCFISSAKALTYKEKKTHMANFKYVNPNDAKKTAHIFLREAYR